MTHELSRETKLIKFRALVVIELLNHRLLIVGIEHRWDRLRQYCN